MGESLHSPDAHGRLSVAYRGMTQLPPRLVDNRVTLSVRSLDLSNNSISDLMGLQSLINLETLVVDWNEITHATKLPVLSKLAYFQVNHNKIQSLAPFVNSVATSFPSLAMISMLHNPACPAVFSGGTPENYAEYRLYIASKLAALTHIDGWKVTASEAAEGRRLAVALASGNKPKPKRKSTRLSTNSIDSKPSTPRTTADGTDGSARERLGRNLAKKKRKSTKSLTGPSLLDQYLEEEGKLKKEAIGNGDDQSSGNIPVDGVMSPTSDIASSNVSTAQSSAPLSPTPKSASTPAAKSSVKKGMFDLGGESDPDEPEPVKGSGSKGKAPAKKMSFIDDLPEEEDEDEEPRAHSKKQKKAKGEIPVDSCEDPGAPSDTAGITITENSSPTDEVPTTDASPAAQQGSSEGTPADPQEATLPTNILSLLPPPPKNTDDNPPPPPPPTALVVVQQEKRPGNSFLDELRRTLQQGHGGSIPEKGNATDQERASQKTVTAIYSGAPSMFVPPPPPTSVELPFPQLQGSERPFPESVVVSAPSSASVARQSIEVAPGVLLPLPPATITYADPNPPPPPPPSMILIQPPPSLQPQR